MTTFFPDISLTVNNTPDISLTCFKFPDISRFSRQVVTLHNASYDVVAVLFLKVCMHQILHAFNFVKKSISYYGFVVISMYCMCCFLA